MPIAYGRVLPYYELLMFMVFQFVDSANAISRFSNDLLGASYLVGSISMVNERHTELYPASALDAKVI